MTGFDLFIYALLSGYVLGRWRLHKWQLARRAHHASRRIL